MFIEANIPQYTYRNSPQHRSYGYSYQAEAYKRKTLAFQIDVRKLKDKITMDSLQKELN